MADNQKIRLQVFLSRNGVCSRRDALKIIQQGHVSVNGQRAREPSILVDPDGDKVFLDGHRVKAKAFDYILLNKPKGFTTTKEDRHATKMVMDLLPVHLHHVHPVGRLDKNSEGLLLLTNDGDLTHVLTHPRNHVAKTYLVVVKGELTGPEKKKLEQGVFLERKRTAPAKIRIFERKRSATSFNITIYEGRKRQIRLMLASVGHPVTSLKRISIGPLRLAGLKTGAWRKLSRNEVEKLRAPAVPVSPRKRT